MMDLLILIVYIALLAYTIPAIYWDLRYRAVPDGFWKPLYYVCVPITGYLYLTRAYIPEALIFSATFLGIYFCLWVWEVYQGADFIYLAAITIFLVQTPKGDPIGSIAFSLYLLAAIVIVAVFLTGSKEVIRRLNIPEEQKPYLVKNIEGLQSIPFMVQISMALVFTMVFA